MGNVTRRRSSLRRRILFSILPVAVLAVISMSAWHYLEIRQEALHHFDEVRHNTESDIVNALLLMDAGYRMLENRLEQEMQGDLPMLLKAYRDAGDNPARMDLAALKRQMGAHLDIYIIDANAIIRWATDPHGIGFDFKAYALGKTMQTIRTGDSIANERVRTNILSGRLGDWIYTPTPDHRYIIEIGYGSSEELSRIAGDLDPIKVARHLEQISPYVDSVRIYDVFGYEFGHTGAAKYAPDKALQARIRQVMQKGRLVLDHGDTLTVYRYVDLASLKKSVSNPGKIVRIQFTRAPIEQYLASVTRASIVIVLLFTLVLSASIILLARRLTRPLQKLHETARAVAEGDLNRRANVLARDESGELASTFNQMLDRIASHEALLEETVHQRTRELRQAIEAQEKAEKDRLHMQAVALNAQHMEGPGKIAGGVAHQFNNIMVGIMGNAELIEMQPALPDNVHDYTGHIINSSERGARLTQQLLAYTGKGRTDSCTLQPTTLLENIIPVVTADLPAHAHLHSDWAADTPAITMDPGQFQQIVLAVISNATKAIAERGDSITVHTAGQQLDAAAIARLRIHEAMLPGHYFCLTVKDNGCGMDNVTRQQMFEPFFTRLPADAGLGLSALLGIVRNLGGGIDVQSRTDEGTCIRVFLPATQPEAIQISDTLPQAASAGGWALIADDNPMALDVACQMVEHCGLSVLAASDGHEAIRLFSQHRQKISTVILDMQMPGMNGDDVLMQIRAVDQGVPVWICSGFDEERVASHLYKKGLTGFIAKPYRFTDLQRCICDE